MLRPYDAACAGGVMRVAPEGWPFILPGWALVVLGAWVARGSPWVWGPETALFLLAVWLLVFFRDPVRTGPRGEQFVIAPADGKIVDVAVVEEPMYLKARATRISIFMSVFDVHVNRYPASGTIELVRYHRGKFLHAASDKASLDNEQASVGLRTGRGPVLVRQIAGLVARRIVTDGTPGGQARQGARLGMIRFGARVGAELDSLVDVVSFGVAPAFLIYQLEFASGGQAEWIFCYFYVMAAAIRLARFNLTQAGRAKHAFIGLPSPAAGMTLATFYPFTTTGLWQEVARYLPRHHTMQLLVILLTILMVSNVRYATLPRAGLRTARGLLGLATILFILSFGVLEHDAFLFPLGVAYMAYGVSRPTIRGVFLVAREAGEAGLAGASVTTARGGEGG